MSSYRNTRNIELSTIFYIETSIAADWNGINVVKTFNKAYEVDAPVICVQLNDTSSERKELGSDELVHEHLLMIDIFATSDGQRLDLTDYIINLIKTGWVHYIFSQNSGNRKILDKTASGRVRVVGVTSNTKIDFGQEVDVKDRFRQAIVLNIRHDE